jgi:Uma2 family endonuclease
MHLGRPAHCAAIHEPSPTCDDLVERLPLALEADLSDFAGMKPSMDTLELLNERLHLLSVDEYQQLAGTGLFDGQRVELLHGRVVDMGPMGEDHSWFVQRLNRVLLETFGHLADVRPQLPVRASERSMPEPDFLLVPRQERKAPHPKKGLLVVEISDSSLRLDRVVKAPIYAAGATPEYWIVNVPTNELEVFREPKRGAYTQRRVLTRADVIWPVSFPDVELALKTFL